MERVLEARRPRPESFNKAGELLLSHNQISLLHGLYDRPEGTAFSTADLARAAYPYVTLFRDYPKHFLLELAVRSMNPLWVKHYRLGRRHVWMLAPRGIDILEGRVPARIRGLGPYSGLRAFREIPVTRELTDRYGPYGWYHRGWEGVDAWWDLVDNHPAHDALARSINGMVDQWCTLYSIDHPAHERGFQPVMAGQLRRFICWHVMTYRAFPRGLVSVPTVPGVTSDCFEVEFNELDR